MQNKDPPPICILLFMRCDHIITEQFFWEINTTNYITGNLGVWGNKGHIVQLTLWWGFLSSVCPVKIFLNSAWEFMRRIVFQKSHFRCCIHREYRRKVLYLLPNYLYTCISAYETCICIFSKYMHIYTCMCHLCCISIILGKEFQNVMGNLNVGTH